MNQHSFLTCTSSTLFSRNNPFGSIFMAEVRGVPEGTRLTVQHDMH